MGAGNGAAPTEGNMDKYAICVNHRLVVWTGIDWNDPERKTREFRSLHKTHKDAAICADALWRSGSVCMIRQ